MKKILMSKLDIKKSKDNLFEINKMNYWLIMKVYLGF